MFILLCVALISVGGGEKQEGKEKTSEYLYLSVAFGLVAGFVLSINTLSLQYCVRVGCRIDQSNYDGNFVMFIILLILYLCIESANPGTYSLRDLFSGSMCIFCITLAVIALGKGLACGNGGPMQAIENQKTTVATIITAMIRK